MISFRESIQNRHLNEAATECFTLMIERGMDPDTFIDWLAANIENENLTDICNEWIEISLQEIWGMDKLQNLWQGAKSQAASAYDVLKRKASGAYQTMKTKATGAYDALKSKFASDTSLKKSVSDAVIRLNDLLARTQRQNSRLNKKEIEEMIRGMIATLKHATIPEDKSKEVSPIPPVPESVSFAQKKLYETRCRMACVLLYEMRINPIAFADWANSEDSICEASDWLGGAWAGLKGGLAGGWDELMRGGSGGFFGGFRKGWRSSRDTKYDQYDMQAIDAAVKQLQDISARLPGPEHAELNAKMAQLVDGLKKAAAEKAPTAEPEEELPSAQKEPVMPEEDPKIIEIMRDYKAAKGKTNEITSLQLVWNKLPILVKREFAVELKNMIPPGWKKGRKLVISKELKALFAKHESTIKNLSKETGSDSVEKDKPSNIDDKPSDASSEDVKSAAAKQEEERIRKEKEEADAAAAAAKQKEEEERIRKEEEERKRKEEEERIRKQKEEERNKRIQFIENFKDKLPPTWWDELYNSYNTIDGFSSPLYKKKRFEAYKQLFLGVEKLLKGETYDYGGNLIQSFEELGYLPRVNSDDIDWAKNFVAANDTDGQKAFDEFSGAIKSIDEKYAWKEIDETVAQKNIIKNSWFN